MLARLIHRNHTMQDDWIVVYLWSVDSTWIMCLICERNRPWPPIPAQTSSTCLETRFNHQSGRVNNG